jgi:hypothetical protein
MEYTTNMNNSTDDIRSFIEQVALFSITEIPTIFDEQAVQEVRENIKHTQVYILGEIHGVQENVNIIYTLFKKFGFRQLALEWEPKLSTVAETYVKSGIIEYDLIKDSQDGRVTAGHFALIEKLNSEGILDALICFDEHADAGDWNDRDAAMATHILKNLSDVPTLIVAGDLHTNTESIRLYDESTERHPMGECIKKQIPNIISGKIEYREGQYYNYGIKELKKKTDTEPLLISKWYKNSAGLYIFELVEAHSAIVPNSQEKKISM